MSMSLAFDAEDPVEVASNLGWAEFVHFAERLENSPNVAHLVAYGWSENPKGVIDELNGAIELADKDTAGVIKNVVETIGDNIDAGVVIVTDGLAPVGESEA